MKKVIKNNSSRIEVLYKKIEETDEQIRIRRVAWAQAQTEINNNPMYSEATRTGRLKQLEMQAQTDIGNLIEDKKTFLSEISLLKESHPDEKPIVLDTTKTDGEINIVFTSQREIIINKYFLLKKPDFDRENEKVFSYLYKNPNITHQITDIEKTIGTGLIKDFHKIVENLGFSSQLKKIFFDIGKSSIKFNNPATPERLKEIGLIRIKIKD